MRLITGSERETEDVGYRLGEFLRTGGRVRNVLLYGELGTGKTTLVKGIASAFGIPDRDVGSASFIMVAEYESVPPLYHIDLYRVERGTDVDALGIWDYLDSEGIAVVEWAERLPEEPEEAIRVRIRYRDGDEREIDIEGVPAGSLSVAGTKE